MSGVAGQLIEWRQKTMIEICNDKTINEKSEKKQLDFEAKQNLVGFFNLLLKIDKRNNSEKYKNNENNRDTNNNN